MHAIDNGSIAITIEPTHYVVRMIDHVPTGDMPPYVGIGQITRLPAGVALLSGYCGELTWPHIRLVLGHLTTIGFRVAYLERRGGHRMPYAELITEGDFAGVWRIDLSKFRSKRKGDAHDGEGNSDQAAAACSV